MKNSVQSLTRETGTRVVAGSRGKSKGGGAGGDEMRGRWEMSEERRGG